METEINKETKNEEVNESLAGENTEEQTAAEEQQAAAEAPKELTPEEQIAELEKQITELKNQQLYKVAEFDNFRKRTLREKSDLIKNAGEQVLKGLLPIVDDFERGLKASEGAEDSSSIREGMELIYNKLVKYLNANGVKAMDTSDGVFDADKHDAIASVPVPEEEKKGKIIDTVEKGYTLNDKVLRHAKVCVGI